MKRFLMLALALIAAPALAQSSQPLTVVGGAIKIIPAGNALQIPSMSGSGARCVQVDATGVLTVAAGACATGGSGSVTSVAVSGGTTGITVTGSPITTSGTITLGGTLALASGGTGDVTPAGARTNLGVAIGSDVQAYNSNLASYAGGDTPSAFTLGIVDAVDASAWRTAIGAGTSSTSGTVTSVAALTLGTAGTDLGSSVATGTTTPVITLNVPTASASNRGALSAADWSTFNAKQAALVSGTNIKTVGGVTLLGSGDVGTLGVAYGGTGVATLTGYVKGAGTSALTASASVPGSDVSGDIAGNAANVTGTVALANGGTASTTASAARTALGLAIGSDVQAYSAKLVAYAGGDTPSAFTLGIVDAVDAVAWRTAIGAGTSSTSGTVTSVALSGGTTGLSVSGSPVTTSGTVTLGGTLVVANGGTGAATFTADKVLKGNGTSAIASGSLADNGSIVTVDSGVGFAVARTAVTSPAANDGNVYSGTYTPTVTNVANLDASTAFAAQYMRVGNIVTVSGRVDMDPTVAGLDTQLRMTLPVASALTAGRQLGGVAFCNAVASQGAAVLADATNDAATFQFVAVSATNVGFFFTFTYQVL